MNVYVSGVFDLFHFGHMEFLRRVRDSYPGCNIIAGVHSDEDVEKYKRIPVMTMSERIRSVKASDLADKIIESAPVVETKAFYKTHDITHSVHAHTIEEHETYRASSFSPEAAHFLVRFDYTPDISSSDLIRRILATRCRDDGKSA